MWIPWLVNISATVVVLVGFFLPLRWMTLTWSYALLAFGVIDYFYPTYWEYIRTLTFG